MGPGGFIYGTVGYVVSGGEYNADSQHGAYVQGHTQALTPDDYNGKGSLHCLSYYHAENQDTGSWKVYLAGFDCTGTPAGIFHDNNWYDPNPVCEGGRHTVVGSQHRLSFQ